MTNFHGANKTHSYFEGWYFKHQGKEHTVSFIPGVNFDSQGKKSAFIQVITDAASFYLEYPYLCFHPSDRKMSLQIENNKFFDTGVEINIQTSEIHCTGTIKYESFNPPASDIMGPFRLFPFMECHHGIISMGHGLKGSLLLNNEEIDFDNGIGYIEKDWGTSFPKKYLWVQCNDFAETPCSVMVSIAKVPFCGKNFNGCICIVNFNGKEYRLATYKGVQIIRYDETGFVLKQGDYVLSADILSQNSQKLFAPQSGGMLRTIHESASCCARFRFYKKNELLFDLQSNHAGFEFVK
ncbi:MAG TPA: tocopherol cyclase family protein [Oscillospiraceae bacterium]|nr:tocopherol cyclase family protein [Oscillospiraceae bacterium]